MVSGQMTAEDVERLAKSLGLALRPGNDAAIASMLAAISQSVFRMASALKQDAPLAVYFDTR
jgi:hypothetical protein